MKVKIVPFDQVKSIRSAEVHRMKIDLVDLTENGVELPKEYFTPSCPQYEIENGLIVGNRSCLVGDQVYLDTPSEWGRQEFLSYVARIKSVHSREFSFISDYCEESGQGELSIPRPYMHIDEDVFFCGSVEYWNFGFFLTVVMQKVFLALSIDKKRQIIVPVCNGWQVALLRTFFPDANFLFYDPAQVLSVSKATVIGWPGFGFHVYEDYLRYLRAMVEDMGLDGAVDRQRLSFARRDGVYAKRFEMIKLLGAELMSRGYTPLYPELLPPDRIAKMVSLSKSILLDSGSALFNLVYANSGVEVVLFESRREFLLNHSRFMNSCGVQGKVIFVDERSDFDEVKRNSFAARIA